MQNTYPIFNVQLDIDFQGSDQILPIQRNDLINHTLTLEDANLTVFSTIGKRKANLDKYAYLRKGQLIIMGVFDGHGDDKVANYLKENALKRLIEHHMFDSNPSVALKEVLLKLEEQVLQNYQKGSTVLIAIVKEKQIIAANIGDSKLFGVSKIDKRLVSLTKEHNLSNQQQVAQILSKGGLIFKRGSEYRINGELNISRSIGDRKHKSYMSSEPQIYVFDHSSFKKIILSTDGFYKHELFESELYKKSLKQIENKIRVGKFGVGFDDNATILSLKLRE